MASFVETQGHAGDEGNFEALYSTYRSEVQRLASYLLRNTADAEDASQTVFVNVLRALRQGARPAEPRAWLMAITRNVCFSRRRAAAARPDEVELDPERVPEQNGDDAPSVDDIVGALARMLPNQRTALILRDFRGAPHSEICQLMELSAAGAETLLTRARVSFREEIEAGEQPFDCAETKALVEQQLAGMISASERHSLRTHLRHCASCSTLARAVRSSRGKLAGLIFWPTELFSRLAGALTQAPTAVHVAAAVTSTAAVATVAIPVAVMQGPTAEHIEGRAAAAPALVQPAIASASPTASTATSSASPSMASHAGPAAVHTGVSDRARTQRRATHAVPAKKHAAAAASAKVTATGSTAPSGAGATDTPRTAAPVVASSLHQVSPAAAATAAAAEPVAVSPRSSSPATRPSSKPTAKAKAKTRPKAKPKGAQRRRSGRHPTDPADLAPRSQAPANSMPTPVNGADSGAGAGFNSGSSSTSSDSSPSSSSTSSSGSSSPGGRSNASGSSGSGGSGPSGPDNHQKKPNH